MVMYKNEIGKLMGIGHWGTSALDGFLGLKHLALLERQIFMFFDKPGLQNGLPKGATDG
jgi:hypothetical protein